jgi:hypothetical protein
MGQPVILFFDGSIMEFYGEALQQNIRVQSITGIYASDVCEKFSEILAKSFLSGKKDNRNVY